MVLWQTTNGVRCVSSRRDIGRAFEITIIHGDKILTRATFHVRERAAAFVLAASGQDDDLPRLS